MQTFADKFLNTEIMYISSLFSRCDIITDRHSEGGLKEGAREDRGSGTGIIVIFDHCSEITPNYITKFLSNVTSKTNPTQVSGKWIFLCIRKAILSFTFGDSRALARKLKLMTFSRNWKIRLVFAKGRHRLATINFGKIKIVNENYSGVYAIDRSSENSMEKFNASMTELQAITQICHAWYYYNLNWTIKP